MWLVAFFAALAYAVMLGLPAYFLVRWLNLTVWWMSLICGFIIGGGPTAVAFFGFEFGEYAVVTLALGMFGMLGGFAAWLTWHRLGRCMAGPRPVGR